jgi:hypothetical protein
MQRRDPISFCLRSCLFLIGAIREKSVLSLHIFEETHDRKFPNITLVAFK